MGRRKEEELRVTGRRKGSMRKGEELWRIVKDKEEKVLSWRNPK